MKLVEIKNSLAKLYYEPADFQLCLSDFLTVDDGNQKIIAQVVSIESTSNDTTNCAVLKFSLDLNADNSFSTYSGYVPPLDALVSKTQPRIIASIFSDEKTGINIGQLTNSSKMPIYTKSSLFNKFLYVQVDVFEEKSKLTEKILKFNNKFNKKTLVVDTEGIEEYNNYSLIKLGENFKLPVSNETLNYIYENDLSGLTVEQKAIVQDIILEIQEYIETLDEKYIPFNTLLSVVNSIYESDKSVGVILFRNKLLKYKEQDIFASSQEEINALNDSLRNCNITVLSLGKISGNWQKETLNYILKASSDPFYLVLNIKDDIVDSEILNRIYKNHSISPIIYSSYESEYAQQLKSFAKNLILFKPQQQQKAFATYNSFLNKLAQGEFIISGETTFYTPLIIKNMPENLEPKQTEQLVPEENQIQNNKVIADLSVQTTGQDSHIEEAELISAEESDSIGESFDLQTDDLPEIDNIEDLQIEEPDNSEIKNIFDESLEDQIAKDVDKMFYAEAENTNLHQEPQNNSDIQNAQINYDEMFADADLDLIDEINTEEITEDNGSNDIISLDELSDKDEIIQDDIDELPGLGDDFDVTDTPLSAEPIENTLTENVDLPGIPIYPAEIEKPSATGKGDIKFSEGNIVYHAKYGKGVVEQLITYGNKVLCSIQFDNVGRRLLDPNLADLKQM